MRLRDCVTVIAGPLAGRHGTVMALDDLGASAIHVHLDHPSNEPCATYAFSSDALSVRGQKR